MKFFVVGCVSLFFVSACKDREFNSDIASRPLGLHPTEDPLPDEQKYIDEAVKFALDNVAKGRRDTGKSSRDAHAKAHGCVRGVFELEPTRPSDLKIGVFAQEKSFPAWVRFSSSSPRAQSDTTGDGLGMAIKLMGVPGKKLLDSEIDAQTQDFLLVNHPVFVASNLPDYSSLLKNPLIFAATHPKSAWILSRILGKKNADPSEIRYWSMAAYALGQRAAKYTAVPCEKPVTPYPENPTDNYLGDNLEKHLNNRGVCYHFMIQIQKDRESTPVENPMVEWSEDVAPFRKVGTLRIPPQAFRSPKQQEFCENMSFTPWHSLPEHQPLGNLNRARRHIYEAVSKQRHADNGVPRVEPTGNETFN
jgi:hypothetical protein